MGNVIRTKREGNSSLRGAQDANKEQVTGGRPPPPEDIATINEEMQALTEELKNNYCEKVQGSEMKLKEKQDCLELTSNVFHKMGLFSEKKAQQTYLKDGKASPRK